MSKVLERKYFRKKAVKHFRAGGIVTLKMDKGGEANILGDDPLGSDFNVTETVILPSGEKKQVVTEPKMSDLAAVNLGLISREEYLAKEKAKEEERKKADIVDVDKAEAAIAEAKKKEEEVKPIQVAGVYSSGNKTIDNKFKQYEDKNFGEKPIAKKPKDETPPDPVETSTKTEIKKLMDEITNERKDGRPINLPLMSLALGLMKGTSTQAGLSGFSQIFANAGEDALDVFIEQEKQKSDADMEKLELATKLKISQDEVAARKYAVDKQAELYGLKKFDPTKKAEAEASYDRLLTSYQGVNQVLKLLEDPSQVSTVAQISSDIQGVAESLFGYIPAETPAPRQINQVITHLQLSLTDLLKDLKPVSKNELLLLQRNIGELGYFKSPQDLKNKLTALQFQLYKGLERSQRNFDYNYTGAFGQGGITGFTDVDGLGLKGHIELKAKEKTTDEK